MPVVLIILDGWGIGPLGSEASRVNHGNAISLAKKPNWDFFYKNFPHSKLEASGIFAGLPKKQAGNSEAGHMNIGAGRIVKQDIVNINNEIDNGKFYHNPCLIEGLHHLEGHKNARVHVMGLLTAENSAHAYPKHLYALLDFFHRNKVSPVYLHLFTDGRDSDQFEGVRLIEKLVRNFKNNEIISTIVGRYYAMDRGRNWARTKLAYELLTQGKGGAADNTQKAVNQAYSHGFSDEFIPPTYLNNPKKQSKLIRDGDLVVFFNCRSERARQLTKPFVQKDFEKRGGFNRRVILKNLHFMTFTDFGDDLDHIHNAYPKEILEDTLPCALAAGGKTQVYIGETEKFAQMTYFLNGGSGQARCGEKRIRIPSCKVNTFEDCPKMSTRAITNKILSLIDKSQSDFISANFANADMLAHTGNIKATIKGIETIDQELGRIYNRLKKKNGV